MDFEITQDILFAKYGRLVLENELLRERVRVLTRDLDQMREATKKDAHVPKLNGKVPS